MPRVRLAVAFLACISMPLAGIASWHSAVASAVAPADSTAPASAMHAVMAGGCSMGAGAVKAGAPDLDSAPAAPASKCCDGKAGGDCCASCLLVGALPPTGMTRGAFPVRGAAPAAAPSLALQGEPSRLWRPPRHDAPAAS